MAVSKYEKEYEIRSYECDKNGDLRLLTLMNIFQDMADDHAARLGLGLDFCRERGLAWVGSNYYLQINALPRLHDHIIVTTWPAVEKKLGAIRDFTVKNREGKEIIRAVSQWILINFEKKRPVSLRDNLPEYSIVQDRAINICDFAKLPDITREDLKTSFKVRFDDIDINNHVNNAVYPLWASESVGDDFRTQHRPREVEIAFKKEGHLGENISVITELAAQTSLHSIRAEGDERELAKVKILWQKL